MQKKTFGILLVLCMLLGVLIAIPAAAADVIEIATADDLLKLMNGTYPLDGSYKLTENIDLTGKTQTPIGSGTTAANCFSGVFDGNGKTISGLSLNVTTAGAGLFGCAGEGAVIKDLTVKGSVTSTANATGGIVGYGRTNLTIENCVNYATVSGKQRAAGILGGYDATKGYTSVLTVKNCSNYGTITGSDSRCGGVIGGLLPSTSDFTGYIYNCYNEGTVDAVAGNGGIVGFIKNGVNSVQSSLTIEKCVNKGAIYGTGSGNGGIIGRMECQGAAPATVSGHWKVIDCVNYGTITDRAGTGAYSGGVVGCATATAHYITVTACMNQGTVTTNASLAYVSGVVGYMRSYKQTLCTLTNSYNTGSVSASSASSGGVSGIVYTPYDPTAATPIVTNTIANNVNAGTSIDAGTAPTNGVNANSAGAVDGGTNNYTKSGDNWVDETGATVTTFDSLDTSIWLITANGPDMKKYHTVHAWEYADASQHKCACGETADHGDWTDAEDGENHKCACGATAEHTYNNDPYICDVCGADRPAITLTLTPEAPFARGFYIDGLLDGATVFVECTVAKVDGKWIATASLTGDDASHYKFADDENAFEVTPADEMIVTVSAANGTVTTNNEFFSGTENCSVTVVANAPASGYDFAGWYIGDEKVSGNEEYTYTFDAWEDVTLTATYERNAEGQEQDREEAQRRTNMWIAIAAALRNKKACTVTYKTTGAADHVTVTVKKGTTITAPEPPVKEGYTFVGWYKDINGLKPFDFTAKITGDVTIYAKWVKN